MKELICISCPLGCRMTVEEKGGEYVVTGNTCPRGKQYAIDEITAPKRMVTSSVPVVNGTEKTVSIKTVQPIAKELIFKALRELDNVIITAPVAIGDIIVKNAAQSGVDFVATRKVERE